MNEAKHTGERFNFDHEWKDVVKAQQSRITKLESQLSEVHRHLCDQGSDICHLTNQLSEARQQNRELREALSKSRHNLHGEDINGHCLCNQCQFVRARDKALKGGG